MNTKTEYTGEPGQIEPIFGTRAALGALSIFGTTIKKPESVVTMDTIALHAHKNPMVLYHANCFDGFAAAWVFYYVQDMIEQSFDFIPVQYNELPPDVTGRMVYIVDFSYKRDILLSMALKAEGLVLLDHHKTAQEDLEGLQDIIIEELQIAVAERGDTRAFADYAELYEIRFDMELSGALLAWNYWEEVFEQHGVSRPVLLDHVQDRDLWRFKLPHTREIMATVGSYEWDFKTWTDMMLGTSTLNLAASGVALLRMHDKQVRDMLVHTPRFMAIGGYNNVPVLNCPSNLTSDVCGKMAQNHNGGKLFAAVYVDTATHRLFSLRSGEEGTDVSLVAQIYGGGGHKRAAGFKVSREHPLAQQ